MTTTGVAAVLFAAAAGVALAFELALAAGAPWGAFAMGGRFPGRLPPALRVAAVVQAALLGSMVAVVAARASLAWSGWAGGDPLWTWLVVAFSTLSIGVNAISPSRGERRLWVPVAATLLASSLYVALASA